MCSGICYVESSQNPTLLKVGDWVCKGKMGGGVNPTGVANCVVQCVGQTWAYGLMLNHGQINHGTAWHVTETKHVFAESSVSVCLLAIPENYKMMLRQGFPDYSFFMINNVIVNSASPIFHFNQTIIWCFFSQIYLDGGRTRDELYLLVSRCLFQGLVVWRSYI